MLASLFMAAQPVCAADVGGSDCSLTSGHPQNQQDMQGSAMTQEELFKQSFDEAGCLRRAAAAAGAEWLETEDLLLRSLEDSEGGHLDSALA